MTPTQAGQVQKVKHIESAVSAETHQHFMRR